jgi:hypothetical protein
MNVSKKVSTSPSKVLLLLYFFCLFFPLPAHADSSVQRNHPVACRESSRFCRDDSEGSTKSVKPVPLPALGLGMIGLGVGLLRRKHRIKRDIAP